MFFCYIFIFFSLFTLLFFSYLSLKKHNAFLYSIKLLVSFKCSLYILKKLYKYYLYSVRFFINIFICFSNYLCKHQSIFYNLMMFLIQELLVLLHYYYFHKLGICTLPPHSLWNKAAFSTSEYHQVLILDVFRFDGVILRQIL